MLSWLKRDAAPPANPGLLWLDEASAHRAIAKRAKARELSEDEVYNLEKFATDGYFVIKLDVSEDDAASIDATVDRLWREKPRDVSVAYDTPPKRFADADEARERKPRYRIHELHSASDVALRLYLDRQLHRYASLILGETAVATQSLYFEFGSQQALHRDSTIVPSPQFGRLVAAWIALEDIAPESGPLAYVPRSQRFPFYAFRENEYVYDPTHHTGDDVAKAVAFYDAELQRSGLPTKQFLAKRGEVLIWHSALMHGGAAPANPEHTRKSFVVHYSTLAGQKTRECAVDETIDGVRAESVFSTSEVLERDGAYGFANPLTGTFQYRR